MGHQRAVKSTPVKLNAGDSFTLHSGWGGGFGALKVSPSNHLHVTHWWIIFRVTLLPLGTQYLDLISVRVSFTPLWKTRSWARFKWWGGSWEAELETWLHMATPHWPVFLCSATLLLHPRRDQIAWLGLGARARAKGVEVHEDSLFTLNTQRSSGVCDSPAGFSVEFALLTRFLNSWTTLGYFWRTLQVTVVPYYEALSNSKKHGQYCRQELMPRICRVVGHPPGQGINRERGNWHYISSFLCNYSYAITVRKSWKVLAHEILIIINYSFCDSSTSDWSV
jgi:hypothetical protein